MRPLLLRRAQDGNRATLGRHRDAFEAWELDEYYNNGSNPFAHNQYGQDKGTDVLIFTLGNVDMEMGLSFPETKLDALNRDRATKI